MFSLIPVTRLTADVCHVNGTKHGSDLSAVGSYITFAVQSVTHGIGVKRYIYYAGLLWLCFTHGNGVIYNTYIPFCQFNSGKYDVTYIDPSTVRNVYM